MAQVPAVVEWSDREQALAWLGQVLGSWGQVRVVAAVVSWDRERAAEWLDPAQEPVEVRHLHRWSSSPESRNPLRLHRWGEEPGRYRSEERRVGKEWRCGR